MDESPTPAPSGGRKALLAIVVIVIVVVAYYLVSRAHQWWYTGNSQLVSGSSETSSLDLIVPMTPAPSSIEPMVPAPSSVEPMVPAPSSIEPVTVAPNSTGLGERATVETTRRRSSTPRFAQATRVAETEGFFGCGYDGCRRGAGTLGAMTSRLAWIGDSA